jgi:hypothetical protein
MNQLIMKLNIKKYQLILLAAFVYCNVATAQFNINLLMNNRPPSYLSDWNNAIAGQLIVTYTGPAARQVKLSSQLQDGSGTIIAQSNTANAEPVRINPGANVIRLDRVLQLENMIFTGGGNSLATSGKLSVGNYQLCVQLLADSVGNPPVTAEQCRPFTQVNYQLPYLLSPNDKTWLDANVAQTAITFRWSSLIPVSQEAPIYRLQVYEVLDAQTPMQALRSNQPILLTELRRVTQYIWLPQLPLKDSAGHVFIWTVQTLDSKGIPITSPDENNQGRSEPRVFGVTSNKEMANKTENWEIPIRKN